MIVWTCSKCGERPLITSPATYDGWIRLEFSTVRNGRVVRGMLYTLDSLECTLKVLDELSSMVRKGLDENLIAEIDELRDKVDGAVELIGEAMQTPMEVGEEIVFEGDGYRHVLRKIKDEPEPPEDQASTNGR